MTTEAVGTDLPIWLREVENGLAIAPHLVVVGNVNDYQLVGGEIVPSVADALWRALEPAGYECLAIYDPVHKFRFLPEDRGPAVVESLLGSDARTGDVSGLSLEQCLQAIQEAGDRRVAIAVEQASRLGDDSGAERRFVLAERLAIDTAPVYGEDGASLYNVCVWIATSERDLPDWFVTASGRVRIVALPSPSADDRRVLIEALVDRDLPEGKDDDREALIRDCVDATAGLPLRAIDAIYQLALRHGTGVAGYTDAARAYRVGIADSPWNREDTRKRIADASEVLGARVLGQDAAIRTSVDILTRSATGLTGAHTGGGTHRPRGVLFFAGPTGVGKTELAKALTKLVFGNEDQYHRFDMSEFSAEHAQARLIGAPPGYVGYGGGGELTNAMRRQPFSLVLFDEIEKAHPLILDKFLQILDDGRLTDGAGSTVYFSEAIIVFTSNRGMNEELAGGGRIVPGCDPALMEEAVRRGVERYFCESPPDGLGRPEIYNRLGGNIVVFRHITPEIADQIFALCIDRVRERLGSTHRAELVVEPEPYERLRRFAVADLTMGGRGIGSALERSFVNPLSRAVFVEPPSPGDTVRVRAVSQTDEGWEVELG